MIIGLKDALKFIGVSVVTACAVFICTFYLNYYLDALALEGEVTEAFRPLYDAQMLSAKFTCAITGGILLSLSAVLLIFYVGLYVDANAKALGLLKALGYSDLRIASRFWVFGASVFTGAALGHGVGYAMTPTIYGLMSDGLLEVPIHYHFVLTACFVIVPTVIFSALAVLGALLKLRRPALSLLRGKTERAAVHRSGKSSRSFLTESMLKTPASHKALAFFVAVAAFCFSAMLQMSWSMKDISSLTMGIIMLVMGVTLAITAFLLALTSLTRANAKSVALMKSYGYGFWEYGNAVFGGFRLFAWAGFAVGTVYQWGLLRALLDLVFKDISSRVEYHFNVPAFFITLAVFLVVYEGAILFFTYRIGKRNVREYVNE